jgi:hypothetical protein
MKKNKSSILKGAWALAGLIVFSSAAFSLGLNVTTWRDATATGYAVFDKDGATKLPAGCLVQVILGNQAPPNASGNFVAAGGISIADNNPTQYNASGFPAKVGGDNTGVTAADVAGEFDYNFNGNVDPAPGPVYVRVWNTSSPAKGAYYATQAGYMTGPGTPPTDLLVSLTTNYCADTPYQPWVYEVDETGASAYADDTTGATITRTGNLAIYAKQKTGTNGIREITAFNWKVGTSSDISSAVSFSGAGPISLGTKAVSVLECDVNHIKIDTANIASGTTLYFWANYRNAFTAGDNYSNARSYTVSGVTTPVGGGSGSAAFSLQPGINTISMPCDTTKAMNVNFGSGTAVNIPAPAAGSYITIGQLVKAINQAIGGSVPAVTVVGYYDATHQQHVGLAPVGYDGSGNVTSGTPYGTDYTLTPSAAYTAAKAAALPVARGGAIQITVPYVTAGATLTLSQ